MRLTGSTIFTFLLLALVTMFLVIGAGYSVRAAIGPVAVGIPAAILLVTQIVLDVRKRKAAEAAQLEVSEEKVVRRKYVIVIAWIAGLLVGTYLFGIIITFPLFTLINIRFNGWGWLLSVILAAGIFILLFGGFQLALGVQLYKGIFF